MTPTELVERFHRELWAAADPGAVDRYVAPDARVVMTGSDSATVEVIHADVERYFAAFSDITTEIVELFGTGDQAVLWWRTAGTHTGPYGDIAPEPTGRQIVMEGVDVYRVAHDRIVAVRSCWDAAAVYRQFGLLADGL
jgi:predicted ester cyclase